jgi:hypothetical protein
MSWNGTDLRQLCFSVAQIHFRAIDSVVSTSLCAVRFFWPLFVFGSIPK